MSRVSREELLQKLQSVQPGLSPNEKTDQSSYFAFKDGQVCTFNEEIACTQECGLNISCAVKAAPLLDLLTKMTEEFVEVKRTKSKLMVYGKSGRKCGITMDKKIRLPIHIVEEVTKWKELPEGFLEAVDMVHRCTGKDDKLFPTLCVHITPKFMEALDNQQIVRYKIQTPLTENILVLGKSIRHIVHLGMKEFSMTPSWLHFRNSVGLVMSCRRYALDFPSEQITKKLKLEGTPTSLPKGLGDALEKAAIFAETNVTIQLEKGKIWVKGRGVNGFYMEPKDVSYSGPEISFLISPDLLKEVVKRHNECQVNDSHLKVSAGRLRYICCLNKKEKKDDA